MTEKLDVTDKIEMIKQRMPETYAYILSKVKTMGNTAYKQVYRGLRGEPDCFYAFEGGRVVGTPFALSDIQAEVGKHLVMWGSAFVCILAAPETFKEAGK